MNIETTDIRNGIRRRTVTILSTHGGISPSLGLLINIRSGKYYGKVYQQQPFEECRNEHGLEYENTIYTRTNDALLSMSPNFIKYYKTLTVQPGEIETLENAMEAKTRRRKRCKVDTNREYKIMILERIEDIQTLDEFINNLHTDDSILKVCAQVIVSLAVMSRLGLKHNDLHPRNVLVEKLSQRQNLVYRDHKGNVIATIMDVRYKIYIFDWDMSYYKSIGSNPRVESLKHLGITNFIDYSYDLLFFLCALIQYIDVQTNPITKSYLDGMAGFFRLESLQPISGQPSSVSSPACRMSPSIQSSAYRDSKLFFYMHLHNDRFMQFVSVTPYFIGLLN
jgi:serine/threonine protein kinase